MRFHDGFGALAQQGIKGIPQGVSGLMLPILILAIFYFLIWMPMRKRDKAAQRLRDNLKPGDRVITQGGILGTVKGVEGDVLKLRVAENVTVSVLKSAVAGLQPGEEQQAS